MSDGPNFPTADDAAAIDRYMAKLAREEEDAIKRSQGQHILDVYAGRRDAPSPILDAINRAYQAKAGEATDEK